MAKLREIEKGTQRTLDGLQQCCRMLEKLTPYLGRIARYARNMDSDYDPLVTLAPGLERLDEVITQIRADLADAAAMGQPLGEQESGVFQGLSGVFSAVGAAPAAADAAEQDGEDCVLRGQSPSLPLSTVLQFIAMQQKSGRLQVTTEEETFDIELSDGNVVHAVSDATPLDERIGSILMKQGAIGAEQLLEFLETFSGAGRPLGELLDQEGVVTRQDLEAALREQVQLLFRRLFAQTDAKFSFFEGDEAAPDIHVREDITPLLLESARTKDETAREPEKDWEDWLK